MYIILCISIQLKIEGEIVVHVVIGHARIWQKLLPMDTIVKKIAFIGYYSEPCSYHHNSPYSVQDINNGAVPWAFTDKVGGLFGGDSMGKAIKWLKDNDFEWAVLHE